MWYETTTTLWTTNMSPELSKQDLCRMVISSIEEVDANEIQGTTNLSTNMFFLFSFFFYFLIQIWLIPCLKFRIVLRFFIIDEITLFTNWRLMSLLQILCSDELVSLISPLLAPLRQIRSSNYWHRFTFSVDKHTTFLFVSCFYIQNIEILKFIWL